MITEENVKRVPYGGCHGPAPRYRKFGTYHSSEGSSWYIAQVENNAPAMSEKLWKIREQLTIAEKNIFDAIIDLPPMEKREAVRKVSEHTGIGRETVRWHFGSIMWAIRNMNELDDIREAA